MTLPPVAATADRQTKDARLCAYLRSRAGTIRANGNAGFAEGLEEVADRLSALLEEVGRLKGALREIRTYDRSVTVGGEWGDWRWAGKKAADALQEDYRAALSSDADAQERRDNHGNP